MKHLRWQIFLGLFLVLLSAIFYFAHYVIFGDAHHIFVYMVGDIAFVPIEVLLVTLIIDRVLSSREKRSMLEKLNMVIGVFFSEVGTDLLVYLSEYDLQAGRVKESLIVTQDWSGQDFSTTSKQVRSYDYDIDSRKSNLDELRNYLMEKRDFLMRLLENPNLLEHDSFTELLFAVFHMAEELSARTDVGQLPDTDYAHLSGDIKRVYVILIREWLDYMEYLKSNYSYLFSLAIRANPFDKNASPEVK